MEKACKEDELVSSSTGIFESLGEAAVVNNGVPDASATGVFQLSGEPAVVINGVPDALPLTDGALDLCENTGSEEPQRSTGFGQWVEGREVRKLFGDEFYAGTVTYFDRETGWYRVVYEDGDFEDLEWLELENVLLPLDINIPLKTLALKMITKWEKRVNSQAKNVPSGSRKRRVKNAGTSERT